MKRPLPRGAQTPGVMTCYDKGAIVLARSIPMALADRCSSSLDTFLDTSCALGMNLYSKEQSALDTTATGITSEATAQAETALKLGTITATTSHDAAHIAAIKQQQRLTAAASDAKTGSSNDTYSSSGDKCSADTNNHNAVAGLNMLAQLMGTSVNDSESKSSSKKFKINLFPDGPFDDAQAKDSGDGSTIRTITIDLKDSHTSATAKMLQDWSIDDDNSEPKTASKHHVAEQKGVGSDDHNNDNCSKAVASDDYDDLLDLMDNCK
eukprot:13343-Heterococcus_DN1.PRE.2